ncbi:MAG: fumarylacetoacetate hydrolase family protein [Deltaproteobacteria bacterium]|nr:fumarylacetoacetate hydrolase family protein [Deltaproteobacteria bacterium]
MRYARIRHGKIDWAIQAGDGYRVLDQAPWLGGRSSERVIAADEAQLLCPVVPSKIVCIGRNYRAHAKELGNDVPKEPLLFLKPPSALCGPGDRVWLPPQTQRVEHEAELGVVVGKRLRRASEEDASAGIFGLTAVCDVTARDLQKSDGQWSRAKGFDTFCPVGPVVVTELDWRERDVVCRVNGSVRQNGNTRDMVFNVPVLLAYISQAMTLEPGDLVVTGTPEGVGPLVDGDALEVEVSGVGVLSLGVGDAK